MRSTGIEALWNPGDTACHSTGVIGLVSLREFVTERRCRYRLVITNDSEPRRLDEAIVAVPFSHL
ncbi:MAG: hypothetical protein KGQ61_02050 [Planctomycetes bacterium]|nr:hypothetical protein [Planctomycetota bacterium]